MRSLSTDVQEWVEYMQSRGVSQEDQMKAVHTAFGEVRKSRVDVIPKSVEDAATDYFVSLSVRSSWVFVMWNAVLMVVLRSLQTLLKLQTSLEQGLELVKWGIGG